MIMGAAVVDLTVIGVEAVRRVRARPGGAGASAADDAPPAGTLQSGGLGAGRLVIWVLFWGAALVLVATRLLHQPLGFLLFAMGLTLVMVFVNGISLGISDSNPISSAFVVSVLLMSALGLNDPVVALMAATILLVSCTVGVDMQQDRSTGWRLRSNRAIQFRYQAAGVVAGAIGCVVLAQFFMRVYPVLRVDTFAHPEVAVKRWQSAMTFKFVGAIRDIGHLAPYKVKALAIGLSLGFLMQIARRLRARWTRGRVFLASARLEFALGWVVDAVLLSNPYALSFGGFIELSSAFWFAAGGVLASAIAWRASSRPSDEALPADMSTTSLVGGGLIAGESLYTLAMGIISLRTLLG